MTRWLRAMEKFVNPSASKASLTAFITLASVSSEAVPVRSTSHCQNS